MEAIAQMLAFSKQARDRLREVNVPTLALQGRADTTVLLIGAEIVLGDITTQPANKRIFWFERTEHEMFLDAEADAAIATVVDYVRTRISG